MASKKKTASVAPESGAGDPQQPAASSESGSSKKKQPVHQIAGTVIQNADGTPANPHQGPGETGKSDIATTKLS